MIVHIDRICPLVGFLLKDQDHLPSIRIDFDTPSKFWWALQNYTADGEKKTTDEKYFFPTAITKGDQYRKPRIVKMTLSVVTFCGLLQMC